VLANQASYYMDQFTVIEEKVQAKALEIVNKIGLTANSTTASPLVSEFSRTKLMQSFLQSTLIVVICFLAILSSQLLYSLMLSNVD
jgi:hypothetical protein